VTLPALSTCNENKFALEAPASDATPELVSVIIPVFNGERYLAEAIRSVLAQDWRPLEVIVVDDGSTDASRAVAASFGGAVHLLALPHAGLAAARNAGMEQARGGFYLHCDADDLIHPGAISRLMASFKEDPATEMVTGMFEQFASPELGDAAKSRFVVPQGPQRGHLANTSLIRAEAFRRIGPISTAYRSGADMDWMMRAEDAGVRTHRISDVVALRRIHGANMSLTRKGENAVDRVRIVKAALDRRRALAEAAADPAGPTQEEAT
jgi:glycosyltransferase involved in cell wall biosynthesis